MSNIFGGLQEFIHAADYLFSGVAVEIDDYLDICSAGAVEILGLHTTVAPRRQQQEAASLEVVQFVENDETDLFKDDEMLQAYALDLIRAKKEKNANILEKYESSSELL